MSRLIDADDFANRMYQEAFVKDSDLQKWDSGCWIRYKLFENVLSEQPTVQPERKRGRWIGHLIEGTDSLSIDEDTCSHCGERFYQIAETGAVWNFCPSCGAYMGEGEPNADN